MDNQKILEQISALDEPSVVEIRDHCDSILAINKLRKNPELDSSLALYVLNRIEDEMEACGVSVRRNHSMHGRNRVPALRALKFFEEKIKALSLSRSQYTRLIKLMIEAESKRILSYGRSISSYEIWEGLSKGGATINQMFPGYPENLLEGILKQQTGTQNANDGKAGIV